jgi:hypothetical protein
MINYLFSTIIMTQECVYLVIDKNLSVNVCQFSMPYLCIEWSLLQANPRIHYLIDKR